MFPTIEYTSRVSHFDPQSDYHDFRGFFVLFWIGLGIMVITNMLRMLKETGYPWTIRQWDLFTANIWEMGLSDLAMVASTAVSLPLHKLYANSQGDLRWSKKGMLVQSVYQSVWLLFWTIWYGNFATLRSFWLTGSGHLRAVGLGPPRSFLRCIFWSSS